MQDLLCNHQDTLATIGAVLWVATVVVRPFVPASTVAQLGKLGQVVEVLSGNTKHCRNVSAPRDLQDVDTPSPK